MHGSLTNEATTYYEFIVTAFLAYIQGIYFYLTLLFCVLSGESYITGTLTQYYLRWTMYQWH